MERWNLHLEELKEVCGRETIYIKVIDYFGGEICAQNYVKIIGP